MLEIHAAVVDPHSFAFKQFALKGPVRFRDQQPASRPDHAMPRDAMSGRRRCHREADGAGASGEAQRARKMSVRGYAAFRDLFDKAIDRFPGHSSSLK